MSGGDGEAPPPTDVGVPPLVLLDACCVINLYATRQILEILSSFPARFAVAERAEAEALYVRQGGSDENADDREPVDLRSLVTGGLLEVLQLETDAEAASFIGFAADLDDGEAMTCALAVHRRAAVATAARKARRVLGARAPEVRVLTTADLIKHWAESKRVSRPVLARVLTDVRERAHFAPGRHDPLQMWWEDVLRGS